jgi:DNA-binding MarR family transcriptional regulator
MEAYKLRKYLAIIQIVTNKALGIGFNKKPDITARGVYIISRCYYFKTNMKDISRIGGVTKSTTTQYIDVLEKKGYLKRVRGEKDKRNIFVVTTEKGKKLIKEAENEVNDYVETGLSRLTLDEQETFINLFSKFIGEKDTTPYEKLIDELREEPQINKKDITQDKGEF